MKYSENILLQKVTRFPSIVLSRILLLFRVVPILESASIQIHRSTQLTNLMSLELRCVSFGFLSINHYFDALKVVELTFTIQHFSF